MTAIDSKDPGRRWTILLDSPRTTEEFAGRLAGAMERGGTLAFFGGLGSGKTTFIQGLTSALGCRGGATSPTYTIINRYAGCRLPVVHVDCYRVRDEDELWDIGLQEMFTPENLVCIEWSEKAAGLLPADRLEIELEPAGRMERRATFRLLGEPWPSMAELLDEEGNR